MAKFKGLPSWLAINGGFAAVVAMAFHGNENAIIIYQTVSWFMGICGAIMILPIVLKIPMPETAKHYLTAPMWKRYTDGIYDVSIITAMGFIAPWATGAYFISTMCLQTLWAHYSKETLTCPTK